MAAKEVNLSIVFETMFFLRRNFCDFQKSQPDFREKPHESLCSENPLDFLRNVVFVGFGIFGKFTSGSGMCEMQLWGENMLEAKG